jgi:hypothetical protein
VLWFLCKGGDQSVCQAVKADVFASSTHLKQFTLLVLLLPLCNVLISTPTTLLHAACTDYCQLHRGGFEAAYDALATPEQRAAESGAAAAARLLPDSILDTAVDFNKQFWEEGTLILPELLGQTMVRYFLLCGSTAESFELAW